MRMSIKILCQNIRSARKKAGLTQQQAADLVGLSLLHYGRLERGDRNISLSHLENMANAFNVSPYALLDGCFPAPQLNTPVDQQAGYQTEKLYSIIRQCTPEEQILCFDLCERIARGNRTHISY